MATQLGYQNAPLGRRLTHVSFRRREPMLRLNPVSILRAVMLAIVACVAAPLAPASAGTYTAGYLNQSAISDTTVDWTYTESAGGYWYAGLNGSYLRRFGPNDRAIPAGASSNLTYA